jgi:hypothetical protein
MAEDAVADADLGVEGGEEVTADDRLDTFLGGQDGGADGEGDAARQQRDRAAREAHGRRESRRAAEIAQLRETNRTLLEQNAYIQQALAAAFGEESRRAAPPGGGEEPEPDFDADPKAWIRHAIKEAARPAEQMGERLRVEEERRMAGEQGAAMLRQLSAADQAYEATEEGKGYVSRREAWGEAVVGNLVGAGWSEDAALSFTRHFINTMRAWSAQVGINPAVAADALFRGLSPAAVAAGSRSARSRGPAGSLSDYAAGDARAIDPAAVADAMNRGIRPEDYGKLLRRAPRNLTSLRDRMRWASEVTAQGSAS